MTNNKMAAQIAAKKEIMRNEMNMIPLSKGPMNRSYYSTNKPTPDRTDLESRSIYVGAKRNSRYISDAMAAKFGV